MDANDPTGARANPQAQADPQVVGKRGDAAIAQFPSTVWDGTSQSRSGQGVYAAPTGDDFNQIIAEVRAIQSEVLPGAWQNLTLAGGWTQTVGKATASYRKNGPRVALRGVIAPGTKTDGTTLFTLPAGYRPTNELTMPVTSHGADTNDAGGRLLIGADGTVKCYGLSTAVSLSLSGIHFATDQ